MKMLDLRSCDDCGVAHCGHWSPRATGYKNKDKACPENILNGFCANFVSHHACRPDGKYRCQQCKNTARDARAALRLAAIIPKSATKIEFERLSREGKANGLTVEEQLTLEKLTRDGCRVLRGGWPDFLVKRPDGTIRGIEVKTPTDSLRPLQIVMHQLLKEAGVNIEIVIEKVTKV